MKVTVNVSLDELFDEAGVFGIVGPSDDCSAWVVYLPGDGAVNCDSFEEAASCLRRELGKKRKRAT